jgi:DNA-binding MarR family transcriptional regulator
MQTISDPAGADERRRAAEDAVASLGHAVGSLRCAGSQRLVRLGISMTHFHVLTLLRHHDAMPMGRLAEILDASMSSATGIIDRMEERGLVERVRVPDDRRIVLVRPTQAGLDLVDEAELVKSGVMTSALQRLTREQLERLTLASADLRDAIEVELDSSPDRYADVALCTQAATRAANGGHPLHPHPAHPRPSNAGETASPDSAPAGA